ncbi:MAG: BatB protein [Gammaproteobacteria bacterium SG8_11]|nr:MAG: BatB protein [Gammaproteobacteria bacterium SG8_11]
MFQFEWLWAFALLPLPLLLRLVLPAANTEEAALRVPFVRDFDVAHTHRTTLRSGKWILLLAILAWILFVIAAARPQWLGDTIELPISGRDLMIAVDLSGSMEISDFVISDRPVDRLTATKLVAGDFIDRRIGDRLGLVLFGRQAYLQTPLTFDRETVKTLLYESVIGLAGKETAIGDAIGLAVKRLREVKDQELADSSEVQKEKKLSDKILILLTDGANTAGEVEPVKAAEMAAEMGLKIYTIGIGADEMLVRSFFGMRKVNPSTDLDEDTLKQIAQVTGGKYFRARDTQELEKIYQLLDELEPITKETQYFRPTSALFMWPLGLALALASIMVLLRFMR